VTYSVLSATPANADNGTAYRVFMVREAATEARPSDRKNAIGMAKVSAGLFASRHGPCGLPAVCAARSRPTPQRRNSANRVDPRAFKHGYYTAEAIAMRRLASGNRRATGTPASRGETVATGPVEERDRRRGGTILRGLSDRPRLPLQRSGTRQASAMITDFRFAGRPDRVCNCREKPFNANEGA
jgi:hypothetical protein